MEFIYELSRKLLEKKKGAGKQITDSGCDHGQHHQGDVEFLAVNAALVGEPVGQEKGSGSAFVFVLMLLFGRIRNDNRMLLIIRAARMSEEQRSLEVVPNISSSACFIGPFMGLPRLCQL